MYKGIGVYILINKKNFRFYIGSTIDIERRLEEHYSGKVTSTKNLRPLKIVFFQNYSNIK